MDHFIEHLNRLLDGLFGRRPARPPRQEEPNSPLETALRYGIDRAIPHECGHACTALLSSSVISVDSIVFHPGGGATTHVTFNELHPDYALENLVYTLGGMAGEMHVWGRLKSRGLGGEDAADLPLALDIAGKVLRQTTVSKIESRWHGRLTEPTFDVAAMFVRRPQPTVAALLNLGYRRARYLLQENRAGFDRLCLKAAGHRDLTKQNIESQFGPRSWAPGRR